MLFVFMKIIFLRNFLKKWLHTKVILTILCYKFKNDLNLKRRGGTVAYIAFLPIDRPTDRPSHHIYIYIMGDPI
jgi:hypothetical protein